MSSRVVSRLRARLVVPVVAALVVGTVVMLPGAAIAQEGEPPEWLRDLQPSTPDDDPIPPEPRPAESAPLLQSEGVDPAEWAAPQASAFGVTVADAARGGAPDREALVGLAAREGAARGANMRVEVLDQAVAERAGVSGFVFEVSAADEVAEGLRGAPAGSPVEMTVDYAAFRDRFGSGYGDRLRVVSLPRCALESPLPEGCDPVATPLPIRNDAESSHLVVQVDDLGGLLESGGDAPAEAARPEVDMEANAEANARAEAYMAEADAQLAEAAEAEEAASANSASPLWPGAAGADQLDALADATAADADAGDGSTDPAAEVPPLWPGAGAGVAAEPVEGEAAVLAVTSGPSGETGNFGATSLSPSADWQVGIGTGEFTWSYDIPVPAAQAGATPSVSLNYSAGSVDGMVSSRNTQSPQIGTGWGDFASAFVERRYETCEGLGDLCWAGENASISLNGQASKLIPVDGTFTRWTLQDDPGWRVEKLHYSISNGDNDSEYWKVTTPDGTQYFFGLGGNPDTSVATKSVWTVPVFADDPGEPCRAADNTMAQCKQAYRWNLDRVVDPNGLVTTYTYDWEDNRYLAIGGWGDVSLQYHRSGWLARIDYGTPAGTRQTPAGRVLFTTHNRCATLSPSCVGATRDNGHLFRDVPNDLICAEAQACSVTTPTFFSSKFYGNVRTEVFVGGTWRPANQVNLGYSLLANTTGEYKLYLVGIQRVGLSQSGLMALPTVNLWHVELPNRVDVYPIAGKTEMGHFRVGSIVDEYGKQMNITYGQQNPCVPTYSGPWDTNGRDCFPHRSGSISGVFHKYLTTRVEEIDTTGGSPTMTTNYTYEGSAAWHYELDRFVPLADRTWSIWRGYGTTRVAKGTSVSRVRVFRGMHNDRLASGAARSVQVEPFDGAGFDAVPAVNDEPWMAGATLVEAELGTSSEALTASHHEYTNVVTATPTSGGLGSVHWGVWVGESRTTDGTARGGGAFQQRRRATTYTPGPAFQPASVLEEGWLGVTGDERCSLSTYTSNPGAYMYTFPATIRSVAGNCASTTELSSSETYYDNATSLTAAPTRGNATRQRVRRNASTWVTTAETTYDSYGRVLTVRDGNGNTTTSSYEATPNGGYPRQTVNTNAAGHATTTSWLPEYGVPLSETDPNAKVTTYTYDALGRVTRIRLPTEQVGDDTRPASYEFNYQISADRSAPPIVRTRSVQSEDMTRFEDAWFVYDSLLRQRQTQALSPVAGNVIVTETTYDDRGLVRDEGLAQAVSGTPGQGRLPVTFDNKTRTSYDPLGRVTDQRWFRNGAEAWTSATYTYTHDTTTAQTSVSATSSTQTRTVVDGLGRTTRVEEHDGSTWRPTTYGYDLADNLTSITDPGGNQTTYTYDMFGQRTAMDDPDAGAWSYTYDNVGNQVTSTDARSGTLWTGYDALSRPTQRRQTNATGTLLASWAYDAPGERGQLDRSTRVTPQGNWVVDVAGYDGRYRPTARTWTVPSGVPGLTGNYTVGYQYDRADNVTRITYPAVGGLAQESVNYTYSTTGLPETMTGAQEYVWAAGYDGRGRPSLFGYGPRPGGQAWMGRTWNYDSDQRLSRVRTATSTATAADQTINYDRIGNVTERTTALGTQQQHECFGYDAQQRLTSAYTVAASTTCAAGTQGTGDGAYRHTYTYGLDGNLTQRVEGSTTSNYTYPTGAGVDRPHAPTAVGGDTYNWDANGNLASRTVNGQSTTLTWDAERRLASTSGAGGANSFLYDADGSRLLRTTPQSRTLTFEGHEVTTNTAGTTVRAVRSYAFGDTTVATRTPEGVDYIVSDQQGSVIGALPEGGALDTTRRFTPYGEQLTATGSTDTDRGWIGQIEDDTTSLSYLNNRYYDANIGRFISPDPLYDQARPQTLNPYTYGAGNPTSFSDPTGLISKKAMKKALLAAAKLAAAALNAAASIAAATSNIVNAAVTTVSNAMTLAANAFNAAVTANRDRLALLAMARANPDPAFWIALSQAGSGQGLALGAMYAANPDPGFWLALHAAGSGENLLKIAEAQRVNLVAQNLTGDVSTQLVRYASRGQECDWRQYRENLCASASNGFGTTNPVVRNNGQGGQQTTLDGGISFSPDPGNPSDPPTCLVGRYADGGCVLGSYWVPETFAACAYGAIEGASAGSAMGSWLGMAAGGRIVEGAAIGSVFGAIGGCMAPPTPRTPSPR